MRPLRGLASGDPVEVFNARGRIELRARIGELVPPGVVAARLDWTKLSGREGRGGSNVNALTSETLTDMGGGRDVLFDAGRGATE